MTTSIVLNIPTVDWPGEAGDQLVSELRQRLSPRGDIVSEMGKQRTVELFGEPLTPQQVVERICGDVDRDGLTALLGGLRADIKRAGDESARRAAVTRVVEDTAVRDLLRGGNLGEAEARARECLSSSSE